MHFGWLKNGHTYETTSIKISAIASYPEAIAAVETSSDQDGKWFYPPIAYKSKNFGPRVPIGRFELPSTHEIKQKDKPENREYLEFMVMYFGWLNGLRLNPEGWGHLTKTAIFTGELTDFVLHEYSVPCLLSKGEEFWQLHQRDNLSNLMMGALHWYLFAHSYERYFEGFMAQYMVLDTLYKIASAIANKKGNNIKHTERIKFLSDNLDIICPTWGEVINSKTEISKIRNHLIHESTFAGKPIGFALEQLHILLELEALNCRVIAALFGACGPYSRSSPQTRQTHGFDID